MGIAAKDRFREERYKQVLRQKEYPPSTIVVRGKTLYYLGVSDARDLICDMAIKGHGKDVEYQQAIYCDIYGDMYEALKAARHLANREKLLCITGSLYLTGELRQVLVDELKNVHK